MASAFDTTLTNLGINRSTTSNAAAAVKSSSSLGTSDFLKLLTAQLQNQDPFSPTDNSQMVAQLAQITSTSGITDINTTLKSIQTKLGGTSTADALAYVGKTILTEGSTAYGRATGGIAGAVELDGDATDVSVSIQDANGQVLNTLQLGAQKQGTISYEWDGKTAAGADAGTGPFTVRVQAAKSGATVTSRGLVWAPVAAVSVPATGDPTLTVPGLGTVAVSAVRQVG
ncbi:flagellar hook assembly protein FlgD [Sphingomonas psychrolutea]|uniref:Basal-body rod modification protein FlgD n=1 Tax=Sphingomonas psychrolutea TaxID=1259676 RepID=A0ABQ1GKR2_9SPHN|nr:flagellar hook capping FlgD N-terminal domain-containing protein [Sphingomonas psychrolutea]GGA45517.1 basal-body rod modification protein FlgD [Sphingomonas psychrolutea]